MIYRLIYIILSFILLCTSCNKDKDTVYEKITDENHLAEYLEVADHDSLNIDLHIRIWGYYTRNGQFSDLINNASSFYDKACKGGERNDLLLAYASAYMAQAYLFRGEYDSAKKYIDNGMNLLKSADADNSLFILLYNTSAIYHMSTSLDFTSALENLKSSLNILENGTDTLNTCAILCNIATIYRSREDIAGMEYATRAYELKDYIKDLNIKTLSIVNYSSFFFLQGEYQSALRYAEEAVRIAEETNKKQIMPMTYQNYGMVLDAIGENLKAKAMYEKAIANITDETEDGLTISTYLLYGNLYLNEGNYNEAMIKYNQALDMSHSANNVEFLYKILYGISSAYEAMGDQEKAFMYFKEYHSAANDALNFKKEREFNKLLDKYTKLTHQQYANEKELKLMRKTQSNILILFISIIVVIFLVYTTILSRQKTKALESKLQKYAEYQKTIEDLELRKIKNNETIQATYSTVDTLMSKQQLFKDKALSLTAVSEITGINPSIISNAINNFTGLTFPNYISRYRIRYVTKLLSDKTNKDSIMSIFEDAGFYSKASAYRVFQKEVGCSPSQYRSTAQKMANRQTESETEEETVKC